MAGRSRPKSSSFEIVGKKPMSVSGRYVVPKQTLSAQEDLQLLVSAHRSAVASGGKAKVAPVRKLDAAVVAALKNIRRFAARPNKLEVVTDEMNKLAPELQRDLYASLPRELRATIDGLLAKVKAVPAWAAVVR
jgi:hypothetical protein